MSIYQSILEQIPELSNFYRYEGGLSYNYFQPNLNFCSNQYVYFSKHISHHHYYVSKRLIQYINEILLQHHIKQHQFSFNNLQQFNQILAFLEASPMEDFVSIQCSISPIIHELLYKNWIINIKKKSSDRRIERCDVRKYQGGYGFCGDWLSIFNILTYFYSYQTITKKDILQFLILKRKQFFKAEYSDNPTFFLEEKPRNVKMNYLLFNDYGKYELMNSLQSIVENQLFFPDSCFATNPNDEIKKVINQYEKERKRILHLADMNFDNFNS